MYEGVLNDRESGQFINFRDKDLFEVMTHFSMLIEDCNIKKIQIKIIHKPGANERQTTKTDKT